MELLLEETGYDGIIDSNINQGLSCTSHQQSKLVPKTQVVLGCVVLTCQLEASLPTVAMSLEIYSEEHEPCGTSAEATVPLLKQKTP